MNRIVIEKDETGNPPTIPMREMKPGEVARVAEGVYIGHIVRRTVSAQEFQVERLTESRVDACWTGNPLIAVELMPEAVIIVRLRKRS